MKFGQLLTVKVENMKEQHRIAAEQNEQAKAKAAMETANQFEPAEPTEEIGFVSVAAGDGLQALFQDLGCSTVVSGGQTMNPSTQNILAAVMATPAKKVYVLPTIKILFWLRSRRQSWRRTAPWWWFPPGRFLRGLPQCWPSILSWTAKMQWSR